jgi:DNA-binding transcriptional ArsR family regulator
MKSASSEGLCEVEAFDPTRVKKAQENLIPQSRAQSIARGFQALGHPARLNLVGALSSGELCVCDLAQALGMPISTVSFHLKELREADVVSFRSEGRLAYYFLNKSNLVDYFHDAVGRVGKTNEL